MVEGDELDPGDLPPVKPPRQLKARQRKPKPLRQEPWVGNPDAQAVAQRAAQAVGMSVQELGNLLVDSGQMALAPDDHLTQRFTLEDLGHRLWGCLQEQARHNRAAWFAKLTAIQQDALIVVLRDRGFHFEVIAHDLGVMQERVIKAWNKHCDDLGAQVVGIRLDTIAGQLQIHASRAQQMAMLAGDHKSFWNISAEYVGMLQSLGIVDRAIHRVDHTHTHRFEDEQRNEIQQLVELEKKKERRALELKQVDAVVIASEQMPQLQTDYDDMEQEKP